MNILRRHATIFNFAHRILGIVILIVITRLASKRFSHPDLARTLVIYGSLITAAETERYFDSRYKKELEITFRIW